MPGVLRAPPQVLSQRLSHRLRAGVVGFSDQGRALQVGTAGCRLPGERASPRALLSASRVAGRAEARPSREMQSFKSFR